MLKQKTLLSTVFWSVVFLLASAPPSHAQTLGSLLCSMHDNFKTFGNIFQYVAYAAGAAATVQGIHHFRLHSGNPGGAPLNRPLALWAGAACLLALPGFISAIVTSLGYSSGAGGAMACAAGNSGGATGGLDVMLINFVDNIKGPIVSVVSLTAVLSGLYMVVRGLMKASKYGFDAKANSIHSIMTYVGFGALLLTVGDNLNAMLGTVFGDGTTSSAAFSGTLSWAALEANIGGSGISDQFKNAVSAGLHFFQLIGAIAFVRGWLIMKKVVEGAGGVTLAQGIAHVFGGVLAVNIFTFLEVMDRTFGLNLL